MKILKLHEREAYPGFKCPSCGCQGVERLAVDTIWRDVVVKGVVDKCIVCEEFMVHARQLHIWDILINQ